tara:strand:+ start:407 stop:1450 length:1044 start_codon:yes stop_codon:yes gene_type:complete
MAYVDILQQDVTLAADTATIYNFSGTIQPAQDGSPHITHLGMQVDGLFGGVAALTGNLSNLVTQYKVQVGSEVIVDWFSPTGATGTAAVVSQFGLLCQTLGGDDYMIIDGSNADAATSTFLGGFSLPCGLDASRAHRYNITLGFGDISNWAGQSFDTSSVLNMTLQYGTSTEATVIGSSQQYQIAASSRLQCTIKGKAGWNMLGILACSNVYSVDNFSTYRINNGAFRELTTQQWRAIAGRYRSSPLQYLTAGTTKSSNDGVAFPVSYKPEQKGVNFLNLFRLSAGSDCVIEVQGNPVVNAIDTVSLFPIWVASIGSSTGSPAKQTSRNVDSSTKTILNEAQQSNVN